MTQSELKWLLSELVSSYFVKAEVIWGKTNKTVSPNHPNIVLSMGSIRRSHQPIKTSVNGVSNNVYPSKTTLQVDLYTKGAKTQNEPGVRAAYENTAVDDLTSFINFINSDYVEDWCETNDVSILANNVTDLTELINDATWDYRAMTELEIGFTQNAVGTAGLMFENGMPYHSNATPKYDAQGYSLDRTGERLPNTLPLPRDDDGNIIYPQFEPSPSGGGSQKLAQQPTGWFERVDYKEK